MILILLRHLTTSKNLLVFSIYLHSKAYFGAEVDFNQALLHWLALGATQLLFNV